MFKDFICELYKWASSGGSGPFITGVSSSYGSVMLSPLTCPHLLMVLFSHFCFNLKLQWKFDKEREKLPVVLSLLPPRVSLPGLTEPWCGTHRQIEFVLSEDLWVSMKCRLSSMVVDFDGTLLLPTVSGPVSVFKAATGWWWWWLIDIQTQTVQRSSKFHVAWTIKSKWTKAKTSRAKETSRLLLWSCSFFVLFTWIFRPASVWCFHSRPSAQEEAVA